MKEKIENLKDDQKWVAFNFTDEEDLFIVSDEGMCYFFDPKTGNLRDGCPHQLGYEHEFRQNKLIDSRFDQGSNMLVMRGKACRFYHIKNVSQKL